MPEQPDLDTRLRNALRSAEVPSGEPVEDGYHRVLDRAQRRRRFRALAVAAAVIAVIGGGTGLIYTLGGSGATTSPATAPGSGDVGSTPPPAPTSSPTSSADPGATNEHTLATWSPEEAALQAQRPWSVDLCAKFAELRAREDGEIYGSTPVKTCQHLLDTPAPDASEGELSPDAEAYAAEFGISVEEANARLRTQTALGALSGQLRLIAGNRMQYIGIVHEPEYQLDVRLTVGEPIGLVDEILAGTDLPHRVSYDATYSFADLVNFMDTYSESWSEEFPATVVRVERNEQEATVIVTVWRGAPELDRLEAVVYRDAAPYGVPVLIVEGEDPYPGEPGASGGILATYIDRGQPHPGALLAVQLELVDGCVVARAEGMPDFVPVFPASHSATTDGVTDNDGETFGYGEPVLLGGGEPFGGYVPNTDPDVYVPPGCPELPLNHVAAGIQPDDSGR